MSFFINEDIGRADITNFTVYRQKIMSGPAETEHQIPNFLFVEMVSFNRTVLQFFLQDIRVVIELNLRLKIRYVKNGSGTTNRLSVALVCFGEKENFIIKLSSMVELFLPFDEVRVVVE